MASPWIRHPLSLSGPTVALRPLEFEDLDALFQASQDPRIWQLTSIDYSNPDIFYPNFKAAIRDRELGKTYPFLICLADSSRIIGTTRFLDISVEDKKLEIGVTWITPQYWGSGINAECKHLLLQYCFESLLANRVQFRTKADNARSRRALEKVGATFEGIMRKDKIEPNGNPRNTAFYSITDDDWPSLSGRQMSGATNSGF